MRVLLLTPSLGKGGAEFLTAMWATGLQERGHEVGVAHGRSDRGLSEPQRRQLERFFMTEGILTRGSIVDWRRRFRAVVTRFRPDVIHAQSVTAAVVAKTAAPRVPLLVTVHGIDESNERTAALILRCTAQRLTAVSEAAAEGLRRHLIAPRVTVLSPGIDPDAVIAAAAAGQATGTRGAPSFCCVARHHPAKGVDVLIRAFPAVRGALPEAALTLIGAGTELEANRELAGRLGLGASITFAGWSANPAPDILQSDVMVLPSRREGLPIVILESFALGRPVVATAVGGTPTVVRAGETGWLVAPGDAEALAAAMIEAGGDLDEASARGRAGRELVRRSFTATRTLDQIEGLLHDATRARFR